jgi:predicted  nucleic acid-binding Zn-ribbon protein
MSSVLDMPFDQYQRYRLVSALVESLRTGSEGLTILDVGGRTALLRQFLPADRITLVDVEPSDQPGLVLGDGSALPFADGAFDLVCAFDTLEHVPPQGRERFLSECLRVARRHVAIAGPYQAPEVEEAEVLLQRFLKDKLHVEHRYLEEHRHNGLPDRMLTEETFRGLGARVVSIGHGNVHRWLGLISLSMYLDYTPALQDLAPRLSRFYNGALFAGDTLEPVYRHVVIAAKGGARLPDAVFPRLPAASQPSTQAIESFARELASFDAHRDGWEREWKRLERVVKGLEKDLTEHKLALDELRERKRELESVRATLEEDLAGHRASIEDLRAELARFPAEIEAFQATVAALQRDLEQHRELEQRLGSELESLEAERSRLLELRASEQAQAEQRARELEADLKGHRDALQDQRALLAAEQQQRAQEAAAFRAMLAEHEQRIAQYEEVVATQFADLSATRETLTAVRRELSAVDAERARLAELRLKELDSARLQKAELEAAIAAQAAQSQRFEALFHAEQTARAKDVDLLRGELAQAAALRAELEADLDGHRRALLATREQLQSLEAEYAAVLADRAAIVADRAAIVADRAAIDADRTRITAEREETQARLVQAEAVIRDQQRQLGEAAAAIAAQDALIGALRAELKHRWKSLKRALGPKRPTPGEG